MLVVPEMKKNLLSLSKLTCDFPCYIEFNKHGFLVKDLKTRQVLLQGSNDAGLYNLSPTMSAVFFSIRHKGANVDVWHNHLAHSNKRVVQFLQQQNLISVTHSSSNNLCTSCEISKSSKLPFVNVVERAKHPFSKIHCDLWGPVPISSIQGFCYFVIFVDDFSRICWLYPLKRKSDFRSTFLVFQQMVITQFNVGIKCFQSDEGGEFSDGYFQKYLQDHGILHLSAYVGTPEQNGVVERKHRHVVELGLAFMFAASVPLSYWVDASLR